MIEEDNECEAYTVEEITTKNDVKEEVAMDNTAKVDDEHAWTSSILVLGTWELFLFPVLHESTSINPVDIFCLGI